MTNRKKTFTSNVRKCGYLKVSRSQLKTLFSGNVEERQLATVLLCVQTFAYFSEGQVCTAKGTYICRPGEWITSYLEISGSTGLDRRMVKARLKHLEAMNILTVEHLGSCKRVSLTNYEQQIQVTRTYSAVPTETSTEEVGTGDSLFASAGNFYAPASEQKGGTER